MTINSLKLETKTTLECNKQVFINDHVNRRFCTTLGKAFLF